MNASVIRRILTPILAITVFSMCSAAFAQGTATGPITSHTIDAGVVLIGDAVNPIPIDLDPNGQPWTKNIFGPNGQAFIGLLDIVETIRNVGNEPWLDWHEHIRPIGGLSPGIWTSVDLSVNGNPIAFNQLGLGTADLWLDQFSLPVQPGDILTIRKQADVLFGTDVGGFPVLTILEYPTPEPASLALLGLGGLALVGRRRSFKHLSASTAPANVPEIHTSI